MTPKQPTPQTPPKPEPFDTANPGQGATPSAGGSPARLRLEPGEKPLPEYVLVRELGSGGFGQVWLATGPGGFEVALKFLKLGEAAGETELKAMQMMKGIRHANLLALFGVWEAGGWLVVAMELADRSLLDRLKEAVKQGLNGIPRDELLEYMRDAARGLDFLADKGILHRDVKPHNLFLSGDSVKIADYGLAKVLEKTMASASTKMTPAYSAPEFFSGKAAKWSDQYCLAVSYCQLRGNRLPFTGDLTTIMAGHVTREPDLSMLPLDERLIVARALAKEPEKRWPSCKAFVETLVQASSGRAPSASVPPPTKSPPPQTDARPAPHLSTTDDLLPPLPKRPPLPPRPPASGKGLWLMLAGVAVLLLLGLAVLLGLRRLGSQPESQVALQPTGSMEPDNKPDPPSAPKRGQPASAKAPFTADKAREHQEKWANYLEMKAASENSIGMKFCLIPPGEFDMGSPVDEKDRFKESEHQHRVRLMKPNYMGIHEVTCGQFRQFVEDAGYKTEAESDGKGGLGWNEEQKMWEQKPEYTWKNPGFVQTDDHPVVNVTWNDAQAFCRWLSRKEGKTYRLPSEAEWEYACRAGTATRFSIGDDEEDLAKTANVADAAFRAKTGKDEGIKPDDGHAFTAPVGSFTSNAFGLYDMHGNVWEWCQDGYDADFHKKENDVAVDPINEQVNTYRVLRGGSWYRNAGSCRSAHRGKLAPASRNYHLGFRVVLPAPARTP